MERKIEDDSGQSKSTRTNNGADFSICLLLVLVSLGRSSRQFRHSRPTEIVSAEANLQLRGITATESRTHAIDEC